MKQKSAVQKYFERSFKPSQGPVNKCVFIRECHRYYFTHTELRNWNRLKKKAKFNSGIVTYLPLFWFCPLPRRKDRTLSSNRPFPHTHCRWSTTHCQYPGALQGALSTGHSLSYVKEGNFSKLWYTVHQSWLWYWLKINYSLF